MDAKAMPNSWVTKLRERFFNDQIWLIAICLMLISLVTIYSSTEKLAYDNHAETWTYFFRQAWYLFLGLGIMKLFEHLKPVFFFRIADIALFVMVLLLLATVFLGTEINGARRSLSTPFFQLRTMELARFPLILFLAAWFARNQENMDNSRILLIPLLFTGLVCVLILFGGLSLTVLAAVTAFGIFLVGNVRWRHIALIVLLGVVGLGLGISALPFVTNQARNATWVGRIERFMQGDDSDGGNYQPEQAQIAIAGGKLFGKGPGASTQRLVLPNPYDDYVYAIVVEEYGMLVGVVIIFLYLWLMWRVWQLIQRSTKRFHTYLVAGVGFMIGFQALWHMIISVGLSPSTGITLPLVSYGGTSAITTCMELGALLSVARYQRTNHPNDASQQPSAEAPIPGDSHAG